jgi:beta-lactamase class A
MITRRLFAQATGLVVAGLGVTRSSRPAHAQGAAAPGLTAQLAKIESESGGRLGVAVVDTFNGIDFGHRADERFPICSTFKLLACGAILARVDAGTEHLDRRIRFEARDLVVNSPITKDHVGGDGMPLADVCEAALTLSDNTAGNLMLATLGGPAGLTTYARSLGDGVTRLDRIEPDLNEALPDDPRDTTSPAAMLANLNALVLGNALSDKSKDQLTRWLLANKTGDARLRAGLPRDWRVGDKTGSGERGSTNDLGIVWPPERGPILVSVYLTGTEASAEQRNATIAAVGRTVASSLGG